MSRQFHVKESGAATEEEASLAPPPSIARKTLQVLAVALGVAVALWALYRLRGIVLLLVLAVFFAYLVVPFVTLIR